MDAILEYGNAVTRAFGEALLQATGASAMVDRPALAPTPRDTIFRDGPSQVYHFRPQPGVTPPPATRRPLLIVPSMINKWYVLDLRSGSSLVEALVASGVDTYLLDWGVARDEDRFFTWDEVIARLARAARVVRRDSGAKEVGLLGHCMGATLSSIYAALHNEQVAALINVVGPVDFSHAGLLGTMVDPRWFDPSAIAAAGNVQPSQMQQGFTAMRPTLDLAKLMSAPDRLFNKKLRQSFEALDTWSSDNIPFPGAAYETYIRELYQQNLLVKGEHRVGGRRVDLGRITAPVLTIAADRDTICPLPAARALNERVGSKDVTLLTVPGGHVGAMVGSAASKKLYPATCAWLRERLDAVETAPPRGDAPTE